MISSGPAAPSIPGLVSGRLPTIIEHRRDLQALLALQSGRGHRPDAAHRGGYQLLRATDAKGRQVPKRHVDLERLACRKQVAISAVLTGVTRHACSGRVGRQHHCGKTWIVLLPRKLVR